jgi:hypothetical protein
MKTSKYLVVAIATALLYLLTCWTTSLSLVLTGWMATLCFAVFTWFVLQWLKPSVSEGIMVIMDMMVVLLVVSLVFVFVVWRNFLPMFPAVLAMIAASLTAVVYWNRHVVEVVLALLILLFFNTLGHDVWISMVGH